MVTGAAAGRGWGRAAVIAALAAALACTKTETPGPEASPSPGGGGAAEPGVASIQAMIETGRLDEAAQRLGERAQDADTFYLMGRLWAKKAMTAPLPTPPPAPSPLPRGASLPPAPEFKPEEIQAVSFYEKAVAARPDYAAAHVGLAELLAPHALRRLGTERAVPDEATTRRRGRKPPPPPAALPDTGGIDVSIDRVMRAYQFAAQADPTSPAIPEALIGFGIQAGRVDAAEAGHIELLKRQREKPEPFIRYGDFLLTHTQDAEGAIEQYRQALIWRADDDATRGKIADIFLTRGIDRFNRQQFAAAEQEFAQAVKWITDRSSPQAKRLEDYQKRLREIRVR
jgi:tetratricopeptide (TPR) repeat protein